VSTPARRGWGRAAIAVARRVDHAVGRQFSRARVLVDVRTPMNVEVLAPVWRQFIDDPRESFHVMSCPAVDCPPSFSLPVVFRTRFVPESAASFS
jgi:hypothetical protein